MEEKRPYHRWRVPWGMHVVRKYFKGDFKIWIEEPIFDERLLPKEFDPRFGPSLFARLMPRADMILEYKDHLVLLEFSDRGRVSDVYKLVGYTDAIRHEKVRTYWRDMPIEPVFITPMRDERVVEVCKALGIRHIVEPYAGVE
jgi:hypothetical protein